MSPSGWLGFIPGLLGLAVFSSATQGQSPTVTITEYRIPTMYSAPEGITVGPDGALWFTEYGGNNVGRITTAGAITEYTIPETGGSPIGITAGSDGDLWFTENFGNTINQMTTSGVVTQHTIPMGGSAPYGIAAGPDGALWFTESGDNKIGQITTAGVLTEFTIPTATSVPLGIAMGPDGALWFAEYAGSKVGRITTAGVITEYMIPTTNSRPYSIAAGPDGALWFTEVGGNKIGRITTSGGILEYTIPTAGSVPIQITDGPDGALWFTEEAANKIGRITTTGSITEYTVPTASSAPYAITRGPDGALWFSEAGGNQIGQAVVAAPSLQVSPSELTFSYQQQTSGPPPQNLTVSSSGAALSFTAVASTTPAGGSWLSVSPTSGITGTPTGTLAVSIAAQQLAVGTYNGQISIMSAGAANTLSVPVTLTVTAASSVGTITVESNVATATFSFKPAIQGAPTSGPFPVSITSVPSGKTYTITFSPVPGYLTPTVSPQTLTPGGSITFNGQYTPVGTNYVVTGVITDKLTTQGLPNIAVYLDSCTMTLCPTTTTASDGSYTLTIPPDTISGHTLRIMPISSGPSGYVFSPSFYTWSKLNSYSNVVFAAMRKPSGPSPSGQPTFLIPLPGTHSWRVNTETGGYVNIGYVTSDHFHTDGIDQSGTQHAGYGFYAVDLDHAGAGCTVPVLAAAAGYVDFAGKATTGSTWLVQITHPPQGSTNTYRTAYLHLVPNQLLIKAGDQVSQGQILGYMGNSGVSGGSTGIHLHFQVYYGGYTTSDSASNNASLTGLMIDGVPMIGFVAGQAVPSHNNSSIQCK